MKHLPDFITFRSYPKQPLKEIFTAAGDDLLEVLDHMLAMNPLKRCTATEVRVSDCWSLLRLLRQHGPLSGYRFEECVAGWQHGPLSGYRFEECVAGWQYGPLSGYRFEECVAGWQRGPLSGYI